MERRDFDGSRDLGPMQALVAERTARMGVGTNLHPGDIAHRIWSGNRFEDPVDVVPTWIRHHELVAFGILLPRYQAFDLVVHPDLGPDDHARVLDEIVELAHDGRRVETDVIGDDAGFRSLLEDRGFSPDGDEGFGFTARSIPEDLAVDTGEYVVRTVTFADAAALADVHASAFGSEWTPATYRTHMERNLGYAPDREVVVVAPDGRFAGFTEMWMDDRNRIGHFEPVGVHRDHQRRGVGRILMVEGMRRMAGAGMATATVWHDLTDPRSSAFYAACGFERISTVTRWHREDETTNRPDAR